VDFYRTATADLADAATALGRCYLTGVGVARDVVEAYKWLKRGADDGDDEAKRLLATLPRPTGATAAAILGTVGAATSSTLPAAGSAGAGASGSAPTAAPDTTMSGGDAGSAAMPARPMTAAAAPVGGDVVVAKEAPEAAAQP
jgi:TPR repeat protein